MVIKDFLAALGADDFAAKLEAENADVKAVAAEFADKFGNTLLERKSKDIKDAARREGQLATYSIAEQAALDEFKDFGLNPDDFKEVKEGKFKAILNKAKTAAEEKLKAAKAEGKAADVLALQAQLDTLNAQVNEYKTKAESIPQLLQAERQKYEAEYFTASQLESALAKIENSIVPKDIIRAYVAQVVKVEPMRAEDGKLSLVLKNAEGQIYPKTATENYKDLYELIHNEIMLKQNLYNRTPNPTGAGGAGGANPNPTPEPVFGIPAHPKWQGLVPK
jgi:hypothetical protein